VINYVVIYDHSGESHESESAEHTEFETVTNTTYELVKCDNTSLHNETKLERLYVNRF